MVTDRANLNFKNITSFGIHVSGINGKERQSGESTLILFKIWAKTFNKPQRSIKNYNIFKT